MKAHATSKTKPAAEHADEDFSPKRQHRRFAVDVQASVSLGERQLEARTRDISRAGLCLVSMEAIKRESEIAIELVLTFGEDGMSEPLHVKGVVVWCTALFGAYQIGVKFVKVNDDQARYLNMFIGFLDGSLSTGSGDLDEPSGDEPTGKHNRSSDPDDPFGS
jgi:hypothetical protein